jgi:hypothetical protein
MIDNDAHVPEGDKRSRSERDATCGMKVSLFVSLGIHTTRFVVFVESVASRSLHKQQKILLLGKGCQRHCFAAVIFPHPYGRMAEGAGSQ